MKNRIVLLLVLLVLLVGCGGSYVIQDGKPVDGAENYSYVVIDGMPCIYKDNYDESAISCDWSQWNGQVVNGEVRVGE